MYFLSRLKHKNMCNIGFLQFLPFQLEPNNPLPPPSSLKRKIIIKNKKKHRTHHHHHKKNAPGGESQFHVELNTTGEPRHTEMQGNGEIPRPPLEKEGSRESSEEENEVANGMFEFIFIRVVFLKFFCEGLSLGSVVLSTMNTKKELSLVCLLTFDN